MTVYEALRWANVVLAVVLMVALICRAGGFLRAPLPSKLGRLSVFGWVSATAYGTAEQLVLGTEPGPRIPTTTSVLALTALWIWVEWTTDRRDRAEAAALDAELAALRVRIPRQRQPVRA